ncbi:hypothetical protein D0X99_15025 [Algoriphagus lacus]|uniref:Uncharacterized protein n=1 Tax=Algoriphagus lacus TaxID=2056311 RepID=A0A418PPV6_9BACT|nr:hypothetical protein D0X99_15025 [Algoriphagus lacus]
MAGRTPYKIQALGLFPIFQFDFSGSMKTIFVKNGEFRNKPLVLLEFPFDHQLKELVKPEYKTRTASRLSINHGMTLRNADRSALRTIRYMQDAGHSLLKYIYNLDLNTNKGDSAELSELSRRL